MFVGSPLVIEAKAGRRVLHACVDDEECALQLEDNEKLVAEETRLAREAEDHRLALEVADAALSDGRVSPPKTKKPKTKVCTITKPRFTSKLGARVGVVNGHLVFEKVVPFNLAHSFGLREGMIIVSGSYVFFFFLAQ